MDKVRKTATKKMLYLGAEVWQGQNIKGVQKGPQILRDCHLLDGLKKKYEIQTIDLGNVNVSFVKQREDEKQAKHFVKNLQLLDPLLEGINNTIVKGVKEHPDNVMVTVGGDHSVGSATIHALNSIYKDLKVIWVDAHPDFIDPTISNYYGYHGYPAGHICGLSKPNLPGFEWMKNTLPYENIVLVGIRDIDTDEWINLKKHNIKCFTMDHVMQYGIGEVMRQAIDYLDPKGDKPFHISFDIDAIDPAGATGTGTKFRGGLRPIQANHIVRKVAHSRQLVGLDVVEINDELEKGQEDRQLLRGQEYYTKVKPTVGLGIDLIQSVFTQYFTL